jgi:hypothetical protein
MPTLGEAARMSAATAIALGREAERRTWTERVIEVEKRWRAAEQAVDVVAANALFDALRILRGEPPWLERDVRSA